ncbi:BglG family transcription antiterminator [Marinococcus luteus]|uniref:BglG family transcription antiterminator n=1 Tax=Marinococcus luteus TaxID=1122204 RepID=UPI002ACCBDD3|nr:BglG family transcription antiterminator [Marinococcus luteus]MDZ5781990.1 BglG family transcription antiterminator [Marinococcus luteus]
MLNERQIKLLQKLLLHSETFTHIQTMAEELHCSEKTVRNDLKTLHYFLGEHSEAELLRKPGLGVQVAITEEDKRHIFSLLHKRSSHEETDHLLEIGYRLLVEEKPQTIQGLAKEFFMSVKEIKESIAVISDWLATFELELISKLRLGLTIAGDELKRRSAVAHLSELVAKDKTASDSLVRLFPQHEVSFIRKAIADRLNAWSWEISAEKRESLMIHALIIMKRVRQSSTIVMKENERKEARDAEEYRMAEELAEVIKDKLKLSLPESEKVYFTLHLISCSDSYFLRQNSNKEALMKDILEQLTTQLQILTMTNFKEDVILLEGLKVHLPSTIHRVVHGFAIRNPMLEEIKKMYPYMFSMMVMALEEVNESYDIYIPEDEAGYLVLHFQASIERLQKKREQKKRALIVCELGVGMSHLLEAKLEQTYKGMEVIGCIAAPKLDNMLETHSVDLVLSTRELTQQKVPVLVISPLLQAEDRRKLDAYLQYEEQKPLFSSSMADWLKKGETAIGIEPVHRYELIEKLGRELVRKGTVSEDFPQRAVMRERTSSTSLGNGIAIPHAPPEEIYESSVSLAIFNKPIEWGREQVTIVFLLAIAEKDQGSIRSLMHMISRMGTEASVLEQLNQAQTLEEVESIFNNHSYYRSSGKNE